MAGTVRVKGLKELQSSLLKADRELGKDVKRALKLVAVPVKDTAERLAVEEISHMGESGWSRMRIGASQKSVYIVPARRRRGGDPRPNLGVLLLERAMEPALEQNEDKIRLGVELALDKLVERNF